MTSVASLASSAMMTSTALMTSTDSLTSKKPKVLASSFSQTQAAQLFPHTSFKSCDNKLKLKKLFRISNLSVTQKMFCLEGSIP